MAIPGSVVGVGKLVTPGGAAGPLGPPGPNAVSTDPGNIAVLGSDNLILVPQSTIWSQRLRSFNSVGNPNFEVDQRNVGTLVSSISNTIVPDRWFVQKTGTMTASSQRLTATWTNPIVVPGTNFVISNNLLRVTLTAAQASLGAGDNVYLQHVVEGPQFRELSFDVHSISLLVRSSVAGLNFGVALRDPSTTTRSLTKLCTIPASGAWTLITLPNIPAWPGAGNFGIGPGSAGYFLDITLAAGATLTSSANDAWQNGNFIGAIGQSNFAASPVNSTFDIAFVQHEPGPLCTTLQDKSFSQNLDECLRYYTKSYSYASAPGAVSSFGAIFGVIQANYGPVIYTPFKKVMAKGATIVGYSDVTGAANNIRNVSANADLAISSANLANDSSFAGFNLSATPTTIYICRYHYTADTGM